MNGILGKAMHFMRLALLALSMIACNIPIGKSIVGVFHLEKSYLDKYIYII